MSEEQQLYVPDGEPCPKPGHGGQPTQLIFLPGIGLLSQCRGCLDAFLDWYGSSFTVPPSIEPPPLPPKAKRSRAPAAQLDIALP